MRRQLIRKKIEDLVKDGVKVSDAELQEAYSARNQRVRMAWASIDTTPLMAGVTVPDADLEPYVKAHQAQFTRPERRRIQYVIVSAPVPPQTVSDQDAQAYYDKNVDGVRAAAPGARGPYPGARAARRRQRGGEQGQGQDRGRAQAGAGRRGLRQAREGDLRGHGQCAAGRRSRLRQAGRSGPAVRAGGLRSQEGRARPGAGSHAVRLSRHQGARREGRRQDSVQGRRGQDQGQARGGARRGGGEQEGGGGSGQAARGQGFRRRGAHPRPRSAGCHRRARRAHRRHRARSQGRGGGLLRVRRRHVRADQGADRVCHRQGRRSSFPRAYRPSRRSRPA